MSRFMLTIVEQQQELLQVMYGVFFIGPEIGRRIVCPEHFADPTIRHYLAYVGREAAACATIMPSSRVSTSSDRSTLVIFPSRTGPTTIKS